MFDTEYKKLRALNLILMLMLLCMSLGMLGQSYGLYRMGIDQGKLVEQMTIMAHSQGEFVKILKELKPPSKPLHFRIEPQIKPPGAPSLQVPTPTPYKPS